MVLVSVDTDGNIVLTKGSEVDWPDLAPLTDTPAPPAGTWLVLGAVRVYYGQVNTRMTKTNRDIMDLRWVMPYHTHPGITGEILDLTTSETNTDLRLAPDGSGGVEWVGGGTGGGISYPLTRTYSSNKKDGIFGYLGTNGIYFSYVNPGVVYLWKSSYYTATQINNLNATTIASNATSGFFDGEPNFSHTQNTQNSWWKANFGARN